jgi:hypothetical protein
MLGSSTVGPYDEKGELEPSEQSPCYLLCNNQLPRGRRSEMMYHTSFVYNKDDLETLVCFLQR